MLDDTFNTILSTVYTETCDIVMTDLRAHRECCLKLGYGGAFLGAQLDLTTVANEEYITFSVSYVAEGDTTITRVGLATRYFPGSHTAGDIEPWIEKASKKVLTYSVFGVYDHCIERRLARLAKSKASSTSMAAVAGTAVKRRTTILRELRMYMAEDPHPEEDNFSLLGFWRRRSKASTCVETGEVKAGLPYLALIARLYHGIESTSCQAERNFSALAFLIGSLRSSMLPQKVERLTILRLNRSYIPEVKTLCDAIDANKVDAARCKNKVMAVEEAAAGKDVVLPM